MLLFRDKDVYWTWSMESLLFSGQWSHAMNESVHLYISTGCWSTKHLKLGGSNSFWPKGHRHIKCNLTKHNNHFYILSKFIKWAGLNPLVDQFWLTGHMFDTPALKCVNVCEYQYFMTVINTHVSINISTNPNISKRHVSPYIRKLQEELTMLLHLTVRQGWCICHHQPLLTTGGCCSKERDVRKKYYNGLIGICGQI